MNKRTLKTLSFSVLALVTLMSQANRGLGPPRHEAPRCAITTFQKQIIVKRDEIVLQGTWAREVGRAYVGFPAINAVEVTCRRDSCQELTAQLISDKDEGSASFCGFLSVSARQYHVRRWTKEQIEATAETQFRGQPATEILVNLHDLTAIRTSSTRNETYRWTLR
jgi:hypothetical protein